MNAKLAEIIEWFESDKVNLGEAVEKYEQALALIAEIEKYLKTAEIKITKNHHSLPRSVLGKRRMKNLILQKITLLFTRTDLT